MVGDNENKFLALNYKINHVLIKVDWNVNYLKKKLGLFLITIHYHYENGIGCRWEHIGTYKLRYHGQKGVIYGLLQLCLTSFSLPRSIIGEKGFHIDH